MPSQFNQVSWLELYIDILLTLSISFWNHEWIWYIIPRAQPVKHRVSLFWVWASRQMWLPCAVHIDKSTQLAIDDAIMGKTDNQLIWVFDI